MVESTVSEVSYHVLGVNDCVASILTNFSDFLCPINQEIKENNIYFVGVCAYVCVYVQL